MKQFPRIKPFFIEIIIVILFFSLSTVATLQLLVATHNMSAKNSDLNTAIIFAQNVAESVKGITSYKEIGAILPESKVKQSEVSAFYTINYDKDWNVTDSSPSYIINVDLNLDVTISGELISGDIKVIKVVDKAKSNEIYKLFVTKYLPSEA